MKEGFLYVFSCKLIPHIVKIGCSGNPKERLRVFSDNITLTFKIEKFWKTADMFALEKHIHKQLDFCRVDSGRELFSLTPKNAIKIIDKVIQSGSYELLEIDKNHLLKVSSLKSIGRLIKVVRGEQKITQEQLAGVANAGQKVISQLENGKAKAEISNVIKILNSLGLQLYVGRK